MAQAWPNGPVKAIYIDIGINWSNPAETFQSVADAGYNLIILAFMVSGKPYDAAAGWAQITNQQSVVNYIHNKGARVTVSAGGSTDTPYGTMTGQAYGTTVAKWAVANHLDGVDFDLENFGAAFTAAGLSTNQTIKWVADATNAARQILGASGIITHAPQPPYFGNSYGFKNGYGEVYKAAPTIDWLLIQFYNNGPAGTYASIFTSNSGASVQEINRNLGIPLNKLVVGKPVLSNDAGGGYVSPSSLNSFFTQAKSDLGWNAGVMGWQWHDVATNQQWIKAIYP
eukprot:TRINITY_DN432_c0_g1_i1.p1 TRINITY_DN432_c0_g1~~TRINITY_DN432_c0_g1_i1.p1  ORF type:complete len:333 (+),score=61.64 TRINITY_DN432_c0_g1_i1:149-1000(+)